MKIVVQKNNYKIFRIAGFSILIKYLFFTNILSLVIIFIFHYYKFHNAQDVAIMLLLLANWFLLLEYIFYRQHKSGLLGSQIELLRRIIRDIPLDKDMNDE